MKKIVSSLAALVLAGVWSAQGATILVDFDTDGNWTAGAGGGITSYQSDHVYAESNFTFTGGPALRQSTTAQDGFAGALGTYSWRLRDASVTWTATYTAAETFSGFAFDVRRWDASPSPAYTVEYSINGGSNWFNVGTINNTFLGNSSDWTSFSYNFGSAQTVAASQFIVRLSASGGERIMIDNFSATTAVPEPGTYALLILGGGALVACRRFTRKKA